MKGDVLRVIRVILLLLMLAFMLVFGYKWYRTGEPNFGYLAPVLGLAVFHLVTKPKPT